MKHQCMSPQQRIVHENMTLNTKNKPSKQLPKLEIVMKMVLVLCINLQYKFSGPSENM